MKVDFVNGILRMEAFGLKFWVNVDMNVISVETKKSRLSINDGMVIAELKKKESMIPKLVDRRIAEGVKKRMAVTYINN